MLVKEIMTKKVITVKETDSLSNVLSKFSKHNISGMPVIDKNGNLKGMVSEAERISQWAQNIVVKIPLTVDGLKAIKALGSKGIKTNATLCFSANQAMLAAKAGATYVSPFVGRLDDRGENGMDLIKEIVEIYENYDFETEVIVASVRHPIHVIQAARLGADICTVPPGVIRKMAKHSLTDVGIKSTK